MLALVLCVIGCAATAALGFVQHWPKARIGGLIVLAVICQAGTFYEQNDSQAEMQRSIEGQIATTKSYAAVGDSRARNLQERVASMQDRMATMLSLLVKTSKNIDDQDLKRQIDRTVMAAKLERVAEGELGRGALGSAHLGGRESPYDRIAGALERMEREHDNLSIKANRGKSSSEMMQQYYDAVSRIPSFYGKGDWEHAEGMIAADILANVQSNLSERGVYTPEQFEGTKNFFNSERKRYADARLVGKSAAVR